MAAEAQESIADVVIVVPAYNPPEDSPHHIQSFTEAGFHRLVVVDDGSSTNHTGIFREIESIDGVTLLRHEHNRGKGAALRTAFEFIFKAITECSVVITADVDGQHSPEDCSRLAQIARTNNDALYLGCRTFTLGEIPFRSWWGNRWSSLEFLVMFHRLLSDTQTGLRAFPRQFIDFLLSIPGDGYEYEMAVLCRAAKAGIPFHELKIKTIYSDGNASSHFQPLRDTIRIHRSMLREFLLRTNDHLRK